MKTLTLLVALAGSLLAEKEKVETLPIGSVAPDFSLPGVDGEVYSLANFSEAKALVLIFTCNHCPDAIAARGRIQSIADDYEAKGVELVAISGNDPLALHLWELGWSVYGDSFEEMKVLSKETGMTFPYLYDGEKQEASRAYGAVATPHAFVLDGERKLAYQGRLDDMRRKSGPAETSYLRAALDAVLAGEDVKEKTTRVHGCSTKWSSKRELARQKEAEWRALPVGLDSIDEAGVKTLAANETPNLRLVNVWSTTCGPCIAEFPDLLDAYQRYQRRPFEFITISVDPAEKMGEVLSFLKKQHVPLSPNTKKVMKEERETNNFHYTSDDLDALAEALDAEWQGPIPHTVLIAPGGKVSWRHTGQVDAVEMRRAIIEAIRGLEL
ncbi:MAG: redoxin domain-containing protein [Verrucomicrobiota bacterium]